MSELLIIKFATLEENIESAIEFNGNRISFCTSTIPMLISPGNYLRSFFQTDPALTIGTMEIGSDFEVWPDYYKNLLFFTVNDLRLNKREKEIMLYYLTEYNINAIIII
jgi:hypothetical protein